MASGKMTSVNVPVELSRTLYIYSKMGEIINYNHKSLQAHQAYIYISWYIYYKLKQNWNYFHRLSVNWGTSLYQEPSRGYANIPNDVGTSFGGFGSRDGSVLISFWWKPNKKAGGIFVPFSFFSDTCHDAKYWPWLLLFSVRLKQSLFLKQSTFAAGQPPWSAHLVQGFWGFSSRPCLRTPEGPKP